MAFFCCVLGFETKKKKSVLQPAQDTETCGLFRVFDWQARLHSSWKMQEKKQITILWKFMRCVKKYVGGGYVCRWLVFREKMVNSRRKMILLADNVPDWVTTRQQEYAAWVSDCPKKDPCGSPIFHGDKLTGTGGLPPKSTDPTLLGGCNPPTHDVHF